MQIHNGFGSRGGRWGAYKTDGDGDGRLDIYDPDDAIATAARYLTGAGAPTDWRRALFAYNHASWYVDEVERQAAVYRAAVTTTQPPLTVQRPPSSGCSRPSRASPANDATRASFPTSSRSSPSSA
jgi:hypothetical protein